MKIVADTKHFQILNQEIRACEDTEIDIENCMGQRYIGSGLSGKTLRIHGIPGNALCAYLDDCRVEVFGNAQDATGDTMNAGELFIHGSCGDATGYAMRGGQIYIQKNVGYRCGIHMKAYQQQVPVLVVGGEAGSFLGEYQAGGYIIVLGQGVEGRVPMGHFPAAGQHGGRIFIRTECTERPYDMPATTTFREATEEEKQEIRPYVEKYAKAFGGDAEALLKDRFVIMEPENSNPYQKLYVAN